MFTQTLTVQTSAPEKVTELLDTWHRDQTGVAPGYRGARILAEQDHPGRYVIEVDFTSEEEAKENNGRAETQAWAGKLRALIDDDPQYRDFTVVFATEER